MQISSVMTHCPYKIESGKSIKDALKIMDLRSIRHLPVTDGEELIGIVSRRELEVSQAVCETTNYCPTVGALCVSDPFTVLEEAPVSGVVNEFVVRKLDCALVVDEEGNFRGIFTVTDACRLLHMILEEQDAKQNQQ